MYPNIIFFLIDGLRADQFYGNNRTCKTPNIDSLIQKGMYFEQAVASADGTLFRLIQYSQQIFRLVIPLNIKNWF